MNPASGPVAVLEEFHERLDRHFAGLRLERTRTAPGKPLFALEHGLSDEERKVLQDAIRETLGRNRVPSRTWLPVVVYATEIGYAYDGQEYWQTFEARTPGWIVNGDRQRIRRLFQDFAKVYGGAMPVGAWAEQFSIIAWPITHAVLPTDLQRQLARLLFEFRHALTQELLADASALGRTLASRAWNTSSRFQVFAQNTELLGQVASALLAGEGDDSPLLLSDAQRRIVADLSSEREAARWLREAARSASQARLRGFASGSTSSASGATPRTRATTPRRTDPSLTARQDPEGWSIIIELPDFSVLSERLPALHDELARLRCQVAGSSGSPLARGFLLGSGRRIRLGAWPDESTSLFTLENGSPQAAELLRDQSKLPPGPPWLFAMSDDGEATEVRGKLVRAKRRYLLTTTTCPSPTELSQFGWTRPAVCRTQGLFGIELEVPPIIRQEHREFLESLGVSVVTDVEVRPAGSLPARWDGEGAAEWVAGDEQILALRAEMPVRECVVAVGGSRDWFRWPAESAEVFLSLGQLPVGEHEVVFRLLLDDSSTNSLEGRLTVTVRNPAASSPTGSLREALVVLAAPPSPSLAEIWEGRASIEVMGPEYTVVDAEVAAVGTDGFNLLGAHRFPLSLPVRPEAWDVAFHREVRTRDLFEHVYDRTERFRLTFTHPELGRVGLQCEREFTPLRWAADVDAEGPFLQLIDHTGRAGSIVKWRDFRTPTAAADFQLAHSGIARRADGGLFIAEVDSLRRAAILPRSGPFHNLADLQLRPEAPLKSRTREAVVEHIQLAALWRSARLPSKFVAVYDWLTVMRAITQQLAVGIGASGYWKSVENRHALFDESLTPRDFADAVGQPGPHRQLGEMLAKARRLFRKASLDDKVNLFAIVLTGSRDESKLRRDDRRWSEFLLRLASDPGTLLEWPTPEIASCVDRVLKQPVYMRAAREVVLLVHSGSQAGDDTSFYQGFAWQ
ncbi:MAG: hypothetical protein KJ053_02280 [Dehalococcoidia bacterium]|nr:hypothetical protein [Dehalococcoidia bacterium]